MSKVFYDKPIIDQIFKEFNKIKPEKKRLLNLVSRLPLEDINKTDIVQETVLMLTIQYEFAFTCKCTEIVKLLLEKEGIDINIKNKYGDTALTQACYCYSTETVKLLLKHKDIDVNIQDNDGKTALIIATEEEFTGAVKLLLEHKDIDVNVQNIYGNTALTYAPIVIE